MKVRDLPGFDPTCTWHDRDLDLDHLNPDADITLVEFPCVENYLTPDHPQSSFALVNELARTLAAGDAEPVIVHEPQPYRGPHPLDLITGAHRLTAAWMLGWPAYPAYVVHNG